MAEFTKIAQANPVRSLRTTIPVALVRHFGLKAGERLRWDMEPRDGKIIIVVQPA